MWPTWMMLVWVVITVLYSGDAWSYDRRTQAPRHAEVLSEQRGSNLHAVDGRRAVQDPVTSVEMLYPLDKAVEKPPVKLSAKINVRHGETKLFKELYDEMSMCFEVNNATFGCSGIEAVGPGLQLRKLSSYTVRAYLSDVNSEHLPTGERRWLSSPVSFTVIGVTDFALHTAHYNQARQEKFGPGLNLSLVDWASQQRLGRPVQILKQLQKDQVGPRLLVYGAGANDATDDGELVLLIGVKTAIATNFALRQAIRETWASKDALPDGVQVIFVGCRPLVRKEKKYTDNDVEHKRLREAIMLEKMVYGDLLTDELDCDDLYIDLANKVKHFLHFAATQYSRAQYVMITDDDVYLRLDTLVRRFKQLGPRRRYYSGQVFSIQYARKERPRRGSNTRYALSEAQYPLSELPPFAIGAYFFLSMDCVRFISRNRRRLRDFGGMDDITVALWMLAIQVHAQHYPKLGFLRLEPCDDNFVAFGDLSPLAIREVHGNLEEHHAFCQGFQRHLWLKPSDHAPPQGAYRVLPWYPEALQLEFALTGLEQITGIISTPTYAGSKVTYSPLNETFFYYSRRVCAEARLSFPAAINSSCCSRVVTLLRDGLQDLFKELLTSTIVSRSKIISWNHSLFENGPN